MPRLSRTESDAPAKDAMGTNPIRILPSLLSCDFANLQAEVRRTEEAGADWLHVDVMDGHFVPNLTIGPPVVTKIHEAATRPLDVHLMITDPDAYAEPFARAGAHVLTFHAEARPEPAAQQRTIRAFREAGIELVGIALNPDTPLTAIESVLDQVDLVLVMSVFPGFGGQSFIPGVLDKTRALRAGGYSGLLEMDGGLDLETTPRCAAAGADTLVAGSAIFGAPDMTTRIGELRSRAEEARAREGIG